MSMSEVPRGWAYCHCRREGGTDGMNERNGWMDFTYRHDKSSCGNVRFFLAGRKKEIDFLF